MDAAVESIVNALTAAGQIDNTYLIFASDNGGCPSDGGNNGDLRGTKGTLFEGGTKVDLFLYHSSFKTNNLQGVHSGFQIGLQVCFIWYNHGYAWSNKDQRTPRSYMLYNYYYKAENQGFDKDIDCSVAVRDRLYKFIHTFTDNAYSKYYSFNDPISANDDTLRYKREKRI